MYRGRDWAPLCDRSARLWHELAAARFYPSKAQLETPHAIDIPSPPSQPSAHWSFPRPPRREPVQPDRANTAGPISAELAKKCRELAIKAHPTERAGRLLVPSRSGIISRSALPNAAICRSDPGRHGVVPMTLVPNLNAQRGRYPTAHAADRIAHTILQVGGSRPAPRTCKRSRVSSYPPDDRCCGDRLAPGTPSNP
jgi:hypothetical protein